MRSSLFVLLSISSLRLVSGADIAQTWNELCTRREALATFHQEFGVSRIFRTGQNEQASKWSLTVDSGKGKWRARSASGSADRVTIFNGQDLFEMEDGGSEYARVKRSPKDEAPQPDPYSAANLDLGKAIERERRSCGLASVEHTCVVLDISVKPWIRNGTNRPVQMSGGSKRMMFDTVTGLLILSRTIENVDDQRSGYQFDLTYTIKRMSYNGTVNESLFSLPASATEEVKELPKWNADRFKKRLSGKTAPDLVLTDMQGKTIKLSALRGKTVLLDFWATWCGPCRADGPSLDKLSQKFGDKNLAVIGISVDEDRAVVQKFLNDHPHKYPIALTSENEMPRAYQVAAFPTYLVIDAQGNVVYATEGNKGFSELRKLLKKAGLETD